MDRTAKERLIHLIAWGKSRATVRLASGELAHFLLHPPTPDDNALSALRYNEALDDARKKGMVSEREKLADLAERGLWGEPQETEIAGLRDDILKLRRGLLDYVFQRQKLEQLRKTIRNAEAALRERLVKKYSLLTDTAESFAVTAQQRFLISRITRHSDGAMAWPTEEEFDSCDDLKLIKRLTDHHFEKSILSDTVLRELARYDGWRRRWVVATTLSVSPFEIPPSQWTANQRGLAYWSKVYDNVFESYERPSNEIVEDDDLLDSWFIRQGEKIEQRAKKEEGDQVAKGSGKGRNEVFVMADAEGAGRVYDMNDPLARQRLKMRQRIMNQRGEVREQDMPDSQNEMRAQFAAEMSKRTKDITKR